MENNFSFQWHITDLCNLRCKHCYQGNFDNKKDLPMEAVRKILGDITNSLKMKGFDSIGINLTGGEPLVSPLFIPVLEEAEKNPLVREVNIITNGIFLKKSYPQIKDYKKLNDIKISLEGAKEETNDRIRGYGNFEKVLENLKDFSHSFLFMFTLAKYNYEELDEMYKLAKNMGVKGFMLERFIPLGEGEKIKDKVLSSYEWYMVIQKISEWAEVETKDLLPYKAFFINFESDEILGALCNLGDSCAIMPNGDVYPCRRLPLVIGNLIKESFGDVYDRLVEFRKSLEKENLKGKCYLCPIEDCIGCRALSYAVFSNPFEEDIQCWEDF
ncbi:MAG TPA: radical SAM protein [Dictyoglomaceae bacterium]|nr:radical SAM protein [Dictyoglomaceae bacterium]HOL39335.1 radical SAM protein [Dictyoglomaceae bacterium]HPP15983.1 radical SAM protein [Dictyoglomaceae bacterium]